MNERKEAAKARREERREQKAAEKERKQLEMQSKLEVEAKPVYPSSVYGNSQPPEPSDINSDTGLNKIRTIFKSNSPAEDSGVKNAVFKKTPKVEPAKTYASQQEDFVIDIDLKKGRKNNLYGDSAASRPELRDYSN